MKNWKKKIIEDILEEIQHSRIVELREIAQKNAITHILRQDAQDILNAVKKAMPQNYKAVRLLAAGHENLSLAQSLAFVEVGTL